MNDTIVVNFNQGINTATGPSGTNSVCVTSGTGATVVIASTSTNGSCGASETNKLGKLTGGTSSATGRWAATWTWSNGNKTLTVTLGSRTVGSVSVLAGTWTFNPNTTTTVLQSSTGAFHICDANTGGGNCLPVATGTF
jgi:hypothetical protein